MQSAADKSHAQTRHDHAPWSWSASLALQEARRDYRRVMRTWTTSCLRLRALGLDRPGWTPLQGGTPR